MQFVEVLVCLESLQLNSAIKSAIVPNIFWNRKIKLCNKKREMFPTSNKYSVTIGLGFLFISISAIIFIKND